MDTGEIVVYIPSGVKSEKEWFNGFGKRELLQSMAGSLLSCVFAAGIWFIFRNVASTVVTVLSGIFGSIMMCTKDQYNLSVVDQAADMIRFSKSQKIYPYRAKNEW